MALGPAVPVSRRSTMAVPVGVRANLALALAHGSFDVVHGFEPGIPSLSYLALRDTDALAVATFFSPDRLFYPPGKAQRARLLGRIDALVAPSEEVASAAAERFPGDYTVVPLGVDLKLFRPGRKRKRIVVELVPGERETAKQAIRSLDSLDGWEVVLLRRRARATRPYVPARLRSRVHLRTQPTAAQRAEALNGASVFVPAAEEARGWGSRRPRPERSRARADRRASRRWRESSTACTVGSRAGRRPIQVESDPLADRDWIVCDLHTHTSWSHDCSVAAADLLDAAEESASARSPSRTTTSSAAPARRSSSRRGER